MRLAPSTGFAALAAATLFAFTAAPALAAGSVTMNFPNPDRYTDAGRSSLETGRVTRSLAEFVQKRLAPRLADGQVLTIDITDIDLAGYERFTQRGDIRVLRNGADWPRLSLRWSLAEGGSTVKRGEDTLSDMNYLIHVPRTYFGESDYPYEKRMLADWFHDRFEARP